jgi:hypothetical protein
MDRFNRGFLWDDGAGGAKALTTAFVEGVEFFTGVESHILLGITLGGVVPTSVELQAEWSPDRGATWYPFDAKVYDTGGVFLVNDKVYSMGSVANGFHTVTLNLPNYTLCRISLKRTGGAGATALVWGEGRPFVKGASSEGAGGGGGVPLHAITHENGGADEISVAGLSGLLADPQTPLGHGSTHLNAGSDPTGADLKEAYDNGAFILLTAAAGSLILRDAAVPIGDVFQLQDNAGVDFFVVAPTRVDIGAAGRRLFEIIDNPTGKGGLEYYPDGGIFTANNYHAALQWSSVVTSNIPGGAPFGNDTAPQMVASTGECIFLDQPLLLSTSLLFNQASVLTAEGVNLGPIYTMVNQPLMRVGATGGSRVCTQHNAVRAQPRFGPNIAGNLTQNSCELFYAYGQVNATVGTVTVTDWVYFSARAPLLTAGGTIGTLSFVRLWDTAAAGITNLYGIDSQMNAGWFISHTGVAPSRFAGPIYISNGIVLNLGTFGGNGVQFYRSAAGSFRMGGAGGSNNEALVWNFESNPNNVSITSPTSAGVNLDVPGGFAIGPSTLADGTSNWFMAFAPGLRATKLNGDYAEVIFTSASSISVVHAISNFATWLVNAPSISIGGGSIVNAANVLIQTSMNQGTNRYGLLVTSNPSGGTLNYCARFSGAAGVRVDGLFEHTGSLLGFYGATPIVQPAAYTPTNVTTDRAYDANATTIDELADVLGTLIADLQGLGLLQ